MADKNKKKARQILAQADAFVVVAVKKTGWPTGLKSVGWGDTKAMAEHLRNVADDLEAGALKLTDELSNAVQDKLKIVFMETTGETEKPQTSRRYVARAYVAGLPGWGVYDRKAKMFLDNAMVGGLSIEQLRQHLEN